MNRADGLRAAKTTASGITLFHWDFAGNLLEESDVAGTPAAGYAWLSGVPIAYWASAGAMAPTYLHSDHLGTPRLGTSSTASLVWRWDGTAFGTGAAIGAPAVQLRFPGQYFDQETGLLQNWQRTYDPASGRYISSDPIGLHGGANTFDYANASPLAKSDVTGLCPFCVAAYVFLVENSATIGVTAVIGAEIIAGVPNPTTGPVFAGRVAGEAAYDVYLGIKNGEAVYAGITKNLACRAANHGDRFDLIQSITGSPVTRDQARAIEQALINSNPQFQNQINSIAKNRSWYDKASEWGAKWLADHGF